MLAFLSVRAHACQVVTEQSKLTQSVTIPLQPSSVRKTEAATGSPKPRNLRRGLRPQPNRSASSDHCGTLNPSSETSSPSKQSGAISCLAPAVFVRLDTFELVVQKATPQPTQRSLDVQSIYAKPLAHRPSSAPSRFNGAGTGVSC